MGSCLSIFYTCCYDQNIHDGYKPIQTESIGTNSNQSSPRFFGSPCSNISNISSTHVHDDFDLHEV